MPYLSKAMSSDLILIQFIIASVVQGTPFSSKGMNCSSKGMRSSEFAFTLIYHRPISPGYALLVQGYDEF